MSEWFEQVSDLTDEVCRLREALVENNEENDSLLAALEIARDFIEQIAGRFYVDSPGEDVAALAIDILNMMDQANRKHPALLWQLRRLGEALHAQHWADAGPWKPLDDAVGLVLQIDNMTAGLVKPKKGK